MTDDEKLSPELEAEVDAAVRRMEGAFGRKRYVAGVRGTLTRDEPPSYAVVELSEGPNGERLGQSFIITSMDAEQAEHLRDQLSAVLGQSSGPLTARQQLEDRIRRAIEAIEQPLDPTQVNDTHQGRALWKAHCAGVALEILREGAE